MKLKSFSFGISVAYLMLSCNPKEILEPSIDYPAFVVIDGDTVKTRDDKTERDKVDKFSKVGLFETVVTGDTIITFKEPKKLKPAKFPDLTKHKNDKIFELKGKPFKLVAAGSNLMLGVRDGGIFNEGMLTSYPTLIANQMGIDFKNGLFDKNEYNGLGRKVPTSFNPTGGPVPKRKEAINNLAIENGRLKKFLGVTDNYYITNRGAVDNRDANRIRFGGLNFLSKRDGSQESFAYDLSVNKNKFDFLLFENGLQDILIGEVLRPVGIGLKYDLVELEKTKINSKVEVFTDAITGFGPELYSTIFKLLVSQQLNKGVIINCPDFEDLPYFSTNYRQQVQKIEDTYHVFSGFGRETLVFGSSSIDSLLAPNVNINLKPWVVQKKNLDASGTGYLLDAYTLRNFNEEIMKKNENSKILSEYAKMPIFDINSFYKKILKGTFISDDGVMVDGRWPSGNFFSSDGIYPTAFGQAVIANEIIKIMNSFYNMDIPFINTRDFLN
jgi:hypothetical protein